MRKNKHKQLKTWTVMIYMAGDNNLSIDMSYALEELRRKVAIDSDNDVNLLVYYQNNSQEIPNLYCDFSAADHPTYYYVPTISAEGNQPSYQIVLNR